MNINCRNTNEFKLNGIIIIIKWMFFSYSVLLQSSNTILKKKNKNKKKVEFIRRVEKRQTLCLPTKGSFH